MQARVDSIYIWSALRRVHVCSDYRYFTRIFCSVELNVIAVYSYIMATEVQVIESKDELQQAISQTPVCILFASVEGRDAVNASAQEDFER